ncbi:glycosyltransferase family 2 protein [Parasegetibacter sp. NRK P23]|uniref:glycosyltransferase family 2 protein n=1 Tax=Parasegetibacter sp. NRK P23 TaxID=2942999 RepID=UPI002042D65C|nr:glycosyltransferase family 2 protein [Parasegetibacter sp. NRK P23]MCM5527276.1 glycosyltransferase family 2 protein [Parasegetibacter sp. NRK P23]
MLKGNPLISVVALNWNTPDITCDFLRSVQQHSQGVQVEMILVDNASAVDATLRFQEVYPGINVIRNKENLGFAGGNNVGIRAAKGDYIFIVNNDTEFTPGLLKTLLEPFSSDHSVGVVCPKIRFFDRPDTIQYAGFHPINTFTGRTEAVGNRQVDDGQFDRPGYTHGAHGCAMMVKKEVIEQVGAFPESFFLYYEEWDWSARILRAGYKIYFQPKALIFHKESMSVGKQNPMKVYYQTRNRILYMRRNSPFMHRLVFFVFFGFFALPKAVLRYTAARQFNHLRSFLKGMAWNFTSSKYSPV